MRMIQQILGSRQDGEIAARLHRLDHHGAVDILRVDSSDVARRRLRAVTAGGEEIALALPRDQALFDGAVLLLEEDRAIVVRVGAERLLEEGIYAIGFFFPVVPKGQARIRTQISAAHTREHLDHAIEAFIKIGRELKVIDA